MKTTTRAIEIADVELAGNRTIRVAVSRTADGEPERLTLATGFGAGTTWREDGERVTLPADRAGELRDALDALTGAASE